MSKPLNLDGLRDLLAQLMLDANGHGVWEPEKDGSPKANKILDRAAHAITAEVIAALQELKQGAFPLFEGGHARVVKVEDIDVLINTLKENKT